MSAVEAKPQRQAAKPLSTRAKKRIVSEQARNARLKKEETTNNDFYTPKDVDAEDVKPKLDANGEVKKKITFDHFDSSDEEDLRNTIGNIPVKWYDDEDHIGYDKDGEKISKPAKKGEIDSFLEKQEDKDYWRKVYDKQLGKDVVLTDEQVDKLNLLASGKYPQIGYNPYQPFLDIYSSEHSIHPIDNSVERKSAFIPSKNEMLQVSKIVHAIKMGWARPPRPPKQTKPPVYDLWSKEDDHTKKTRSELARMRMHYPAPKVDLPTHYESYNPAEEYLMTEEEKKKWEEMDPEDRKIQYMPQKFAALRHVPQYDRFISERFERCLDLYLAPRQRKMKLQVEASDLLPDLPNPNDLKPFPTKLAFYMCGHEGQVRCIASEPEKGELLVSGGEDGTVRVWMINSGRCIKVIKLDEPVTSVVFCPVASRTMVAVSYGNKVALINTECGDKLGISETAKLLAGVQPETEDDEPQKVKWSKTKKNDRVVLTLPYAVKQVTWHSKGDYFATVAAADVPQSVYIHQLSKCRSQCPFSKRKGYIQTVAFHPAEPTFFVATQRHVRMYDLAKCQLKKKLITGLLSLSTICPDREGENLFVGGLDNRFSWMDLQLSDKPWKQLRHHTSAIRSIAYHKRYPLLATVSDDGTALVYYARIHTDFTRDNELVPVKKLIGHRPVNGLSMLSTVWHPTQPWLITAGADGRIALFSY